MNEDKDLEKLINSLMEEAPLETPSDNFTDMVVARVEELKSSKLMFRPLITKKTFLLWAVILGGLTFYLASLDSSFNANIGNYLSAISEANSWFSDKLPQFQLSRKIIYMTGAFVIMIYFQAMLLKRFFNRQVI
ncbi:hypothetical protein [Flagellimonas sp. S3867]|uniref:hypothetical protein n=1 Tax=Flagellimonas sp. S3867 TaxID=2768063 RepID=UPI001682B8EB|nr:hypothetical protein [Flagellimonas sp. S3867]